MHKSQSAKTLYLLQAQLVIAGKLADLGQLMAGVPNEISSPIKGKNIEPAYEIVQDLTALIALYQTNLIKLSGNPSRICLSCWHRRI